MQRCQTACKSPSRSSQEAPTSPRTESISPETALALPASWPKPSAELRSTSAPTSPLATRSFSGTKSGSGRASFGTFSRIRRLSGLRLALLRVPWLPAHLWALPQSSRVLSREVAQTLSLELADLRWTERPTCGHPYPTKSTISRSGRPSLPARTGFSLLRMAPPPLWPLNGRPAM